jgi:DNA-binding MarR family transcriptional regulator
MAVTDLDPLDIWRRAMVANVRRDAPDLSARQMAVLLTVYMTEPPHTVRGLAEILKVTKPAITRAIDRLGEFGLARRKTDPRDRRSIVVHRTVKGSVYLAEFAEIIQNATQERARDKAGARNATDAAAAKQPKTAAATKTEPASS